jgi:hypothetical protein
MTLECCRQEENAAGGVVRQNVAGLRRCAADDISALHIAESRPVVGKDADLALVFALVASVPVGSVPKKLPSM